MFVAFVLCGSFGWWFVYLVGVFLRHSGIEIKSEKHFPLFYALLLPKVRPFQGGEEVVNKEYLLLMGQPQFYVGWKVDCNPVKQQHTFVPPSLPPSWKHTWLDKMPLERAWKQWSHCEGWKLRAQYSWMIEKHNMLNRCKNCIIHDFLKWGMSFHSQLLNRCKRCKISSDFLRERTNYFRYAHTTCEFWPVVTGAISLCLLLGIPIREERVSILSFVFLLNARKVGGREQATPSNLSPEKT